MNQPTAGSARIVYAATIIPVTDMSRSVRHYSSLGFEVEQYRPTYARATRDNIHLHLSLDERHDPKVGAACIYAEVDDSDALAEEWSAATGTKVGPPQDRSWGVREAQHIDPDNNMIRFGTPT